MAMLSILIASIVEIIVDGSGYPAWVASKGITEKHEWPVWALGLIGVLILASVLWIPAVAICRYLLLLLLLFVINFINFEKKFFYFSIISNFPFYLYSCISHRSS